MAIAAANTEETRDPANTREETAVVEAGDGTSVARRRTPWASAGGTLDDGGVCGWGGSGGSFSGPSGGWGYNRLLNGSSSRGSSNR